MVAISSTWARASKGKGRGIWCARAWPWCPKAAARLGSPGEFVDYATSKGAIDTFTLGLAREVAAEGVRVNAVRPGLIETEIHASSGEPGRVARLQGSVPIRRGGTADEVAAAIVWLLGDDASYVTGTLLDVTGGR